MSFKMLGFWRGFRARSPKPFNYMIRLLGLCHVYRPKPSILKDIGYISTEHIESAIEIIRWHMQETRRILATENSQSEVQDLQKLLNWLMMKDHYIISVREIQRLSPLRDKSRINKAIDILRYSLFDLLTIKDDATLKSSVKM